MNDYLMERDSVTYLNFSKIFDTLSHYRLPVKKKSGISKNSKCCKTFFVRIMKVKIGNNYFESQYIPSGVPHESVWGLFLFLTFINDIKSK